MTRDTGTCVRYETVELEGVRYAVVRESLLRELCRRASVNAEPAERSQSASAGGLVESDLDGEQLARRLVERRKRAGLTQAELTRRAGVRVETLNRIERGKTAPDFATVRKLVVAMNAVESERDARLLSAAEMGAARERNGSKATKRRSDGVTKG